MWINSDGDGAGDGVAMAKVLKGVCGSMVMVTNIRCFDVDRMYVNS